ncbi:hypothetical protein KTAU_04290 [Thermogemmatispora aurantia]|jgi:hypothetical protein|uniref:Uncharacterized protein n=1 Tax=Thermogemmatispora aurantia TaxID=2045279 RepID=A0A5J4K4W4_9CHLR|nr:hypothetical protein KTAU_04290 [Thermogemmatispora aurantia]
MVSCQFLNYTLGSGQSRKKPCYLPHLMPGEAGAGRKPAGLCTVASEAVGNNKEGK